VKRPNLFACVLLGGACLFCAANSRGQSVLRSPEFRAGQTFFYGLDFSFSRNLTSLSALSSPQLPPSTTFQVRGLLQVAVKEISGATVHFETFYSEPDAASDRKAQSEESHPDRKVEVWLSGNGAVSKVLGLDQLSSEQQIAWNAWLGQFTATMNYPRKALRSGQKWEANEPETSPSPIAELSWARKYTYVRTEPCPDENVAAAPMSKPETCAVILVRSVLRQKSSPKNATPADYKSQGLTTRGSAGGENETILYVAQASGLLTRATESANQTMDVTIALADGSNQVHYTIQAKSRSAIRLLEAKTRP